MTTVDVVNWSNLVMPCIDTLASEDLDIIHEDIPPLYQLMHHTQQTFICLCEQEHSHAHTHEIRRMLSPKSHFFSLFHILLWLLTLSKVFPASGAYVLSFIDFNRPCGIPINTVWMRSKMVKIPIYQEVWLVSSPHKTTTAIMQVETMYNNKDRS